MENLLIVHATPSDLSQILQIKKQVHQYFIEVRPDIYQESEILYTEDLLKSFFAEGNRKISIAKIDNTIVGYAFTEFFDVELPRSNWQFIYLMTKRYPYTEKKDSKNAQ
jgi:hypothetical protein